MGSLFDTIFHLFLASASNTFLFVYKRRNDTFKFPNYRFVCFPHDHGKTIAKRVFQWCFSNSLIIHIGNKCLMSVWKSDENYSFLHP